MFVDPPDGTPISQCLDSQSHLAQLKDLGITTLGELLGATQGLRRTPNEDPEWENLFEVLAAALAPERLETYRHPLPIPPNGLLR